MCVCLCVCVRVCVANSENMRNGTQPLCTTIPTSTDQYFHFSVTCFVHFDTWSIHKCWTTHQEPFLLQLTECHMTSPVYKCKTESLTTTHMNIWHHPCTNAKQKVTQPPTWHIWHHLCTNIKQKATQTPTCNIWHHLYTNIKQKARHPPTWVYDISCVQNTKQTAKHTSTCSMTVQWRKLLVSNDIIIIYMFLLNSRAFKLCAEFVAGLKSLHIKTMIIQMQHKIKNHPSDPLPQW